MSRLVTYFILVLYNYWSVMSDYPLKLLISDIKKAKSTSDNYWELNLEFESQEKNNKKLQFSLVWVQGVIEQNIFNDILILNDQTGRAKISQCSEAAKPENLFKTSKTEIACAVIGYLARNQGVPDIVALHILPIADKELELKLWPLEVEAAKSYLSGNIFPRL